MTTEVLVRSARLHDALDLRVELIPRTTVPPKHVAIRPRFCGICGSDLHYYFEPQLASSLKTAHPLTNTALPIPLGHEFAGDVVEVGSGCHTAFAVGDRVVVMATITDGKCWSCIHASSNTCSQIGFVGINGVAGGLSDWAVVPSELVFKLPPEVDTEIGALVEPLAVAWHALRLAKEEINAGTAALVIGGGPVGCAVLLCLKAQGVTNVVVSDPSAEKRDFCRARVGAPLAVHPAEVLSTVSKVTSRGGFDVVFDCAGVEGRTLHSAVECVRPTGIILDLAIQVSATIPLLAMLLKEVNMKFSCAYTAQDFREVIDAIATEKLQPKCLITKHIPLKEIVEQGMEALHDKTNKECKILVDLSME